MSNRDIGFIIKRISEIMDKQANKKLKDLGITCSQARLLSYLFTHKDDMITQRQIERYLKISHTTTVGLINRLEGKGFISTETDTRDKRQKIIRLCDAAIEQRRQMETHISESEKRMVKDFSQTEIAELNRLLKKLYNNIDREVMK